MIPMLWYVAGCGHTRPFYTQSVVEASDVKWSNLIICRSCLQITCPHFSKTLADHAQKKAS